jgi:Flp pilus assembly pilin Flp
MMRFVREKGGADLVEYALLVSLIAVAVVAAQQPTAGDVARVFVDLRDTLAVLLDLT